MIAVLVSLLCDRCGAEWLVDLTALPADDVFFKVQRELARTVCPECLNAAREDPPESQPET